MRQNFSITYLLTLKFLKSIHLDETPSRHELGFSKPIYVAKDAYFEADVTLISSVSTL